MIEQAAAPARPAGAAPTGPAARPARDRRRLLREIGAFGVVGGLCFAIEIGLFQLLYAQVGAGAVTARLVATATSMTVAFFAHRYWSFAHRGGGAGHREYSVFVVVNGATLLLGLALVGLVRYPLGQESALVLQATNVVSIVLGTIIRFVAYRRWVFVAPGDPAAAAR